MRRSESSFTTRKYNRISGASDSCSHAFSPVGIRIMGHLEIESYNSDFGQG